MALNYCALTPQVLEASFSPIVKQAFGKPRRLFNLRRPRRYSFPKICSSHYTYILSWDWKYQKGKGKWSASQQWCNLHSWGKIRNNAGKVLKFTSSGKQSFLVVHLLPWWHIVSTESLLAILERILSQIFLLEGTDSLKTGAKWSFTVSFMT